MLKLNQKMATPSLSKSIAQVGVLFKGDDKFTGEMNYPDAGGHKGLIGWLNDQGTCTYLVIRMNLDQNRIVKNLNNNKLLFS